MQVSYEVDARELITLETTLLTQRPAVGFREANSNANAQLSDDADKPFHLAIDIARARAADIRPISDRMANARTGAAASDPSAPAALPPVPALDFLPVEYEEFATETPDNRLTRWQKKLLDLTLRNRLLNFKYSKQTLKLICHDVAKLEDKLADGKKFKIISINDENPTGGRDTRHHLQQTGNDIETHFAREVFEKSQVCADQTANEMQSRLTTLYRKSRSDMAEGGTNTLFLAIGFLKWKKSPDDEKSYQAPLLLVPVKLTRRSVHSSYYLSHLNEGVVFNQTLLQHLQRDFGIEMPALHNELPKDESGIDIPKVLEIARRGVRDTPGFRVVEDIALSTFSFAKYLMWKDLRDRTDSLKDNRLVKHLLDNPAEPFSDGTGEFVQPEMIDQTVDHAKLYTPLPADSSQTAAIIAAQSGKDFVIIGPPGTGKSQTIANIIAHCLAHGKTILFVAEKSAALDDSASND